MKKRWNNMWKEENLEKIAVEIYRAVKDGDMKRALNWLWIAGVRQEVKVEDETLVIEEK